MNDGSDHDNASHLADCFHRGGPLAKELTLHLPFSVSSVAIGLILAGVLSITSAPEHADPSLTARSADHDHDRSMHRMMFHLFHPAHMLFSAAATTAMFWRYDHRAVRAILVGLAGAVVVCGISDVAIPSFSSWMLGKGFPRPWHICVLDHPGLVLPFALIGIAVGLAAAVGVEASTLFSHSLHVFTSTMASIFYLVGRYDTTTAWINDIGPVFLLIIFAVLIPCCASDIAFPVLMSRSARARYLAEGHCH